MGALVRMVWVVLCGKQQRQQDKFQATKVYFSLLLHISWGLPRGPPPHHPYSGAQADRIATIWKIEVAMRERHRAFNGLRWSTDLASKWHVTSNHNLLARSNHIAPSKYRWLGSAIILDVQKLRVENIWWTELTSKFGICRHHIQDITRKHGRRSEKRRDTKGDAFYLQCSIFSESKGKPVWNMAKYWDLSKLDDMRRQ